MRSFQVPIVLRMHKKHGTNWAAMHRDIKVNIYQWTEHRCQKFVEGFCLNKTIAQRSVDAENMSGRGLDLSKPVDWKGKKRNVFGH